MKMTSPMLWGIGGANRSSFSAQAADTIPWRTAVALATPDYSCRVSGARKSRLCGALPRTGPKQRETLLRVRLRDHGYMVPEPTIFPAVRSTHPTIYELSGLIESARYQPPQPRNRRHSATTTFKENKMSRHSRDDKRKKQKRQRRNAEKTQAHRLRAAAAAQTPPGCHDVIHRSSPAAAEAKKGRGGRSAHLQRIGDGWRWESPHGSASPTPMDGSPRYGIHGNRQWSDACH